LSQVKIGNSHNLAAQLFATMFFHSNTSLILPDNSDSNHDNQYLYPAYSCEHLLAPPNYYTHCQSEPNVLLCFNNQVCIEIYFS